MAFQLKYKFLIQQGGNIKQVNSVLENMLQRQR